MLNDKSKALSGIKFKDKLGYALGDAGNVLTFALVGSYLQMFYTDVLYIDAGKIMVLLIAARIWDAINDPIWGSIIDLRKPGKNGKFRPYLKWLSAPLAVAAVFMFLKVPGLSENQYLVYAYITYIIYGMIYTAINIPYGSLASVITNDEMERSSLSMYRSIGAGIGGLPGQIILPLFVYSTVAGEKVLDGTKLFWGVFAMSILSIIFYQLSYKMTVERVEPQKLENRNSAVKTITTLFKNRPFIVLCLCSMLLIATQQYQQTIYNYLFKNYFAKPELYTLVTIFTYLPMIILIPFMQKIIKKTGKKEICAIGMAISAVANIALWFIHTKSVAVFFVFCFISGFGLTFLVLEIWALATDVIDYQETLSGQRDEGTSYAFFSFARKIGHAISGTLGTGVLKIIGYEAKNITAEASEKMYAMSTAIPALMCAIVAFLLFALYPLSKKKLKELHENKKTV